MAKAKSSPPLVGGPASVVLTVLIATLVGSLAQALSVPLFASWNWDVPGDCEGQSVKPGCVEPASLGLFTMPEVSVCCIVTVAAPAASWAFESA